MPQCSSVLLSLQVGHYFISSYLNFSFKLCAVFSFSNLIPDDRTALLEHSGKWQHSAFVRVYFHYDCLLVRLVCPNRDNITSLQFLCLWGDFQMARRSVVSCKLLSSHRHLSSLPISSFSVPLSVLLGLHIADWIRERESAYHVSTCARQLTAKILGYSSAAWVYCRVVLILMLPFFRMSLPSLRELRNEAQRRQITVSRSNSWSCWNSSLLIWIWHARRCRETMCSLGGLPSKAREIFCRLWLIWFSEMSLCSIAFWAASSSPGTIMTPILLIAGIGISPREPLVSVIEVHDLRFGFPTPFGLSFGMGVHWLVLFSMEFPWWFNPQINPTSKDLLWLLAITSLGFWVWQCPDPGSARDFGLPSGVSNQSLLQIADRASRMLPVIKRTKSADEELDWRDQESFSHVVFICRAPQS